MTQMGIQQQKSVAMMRAMRFCILAAWLLGLWDPKLADDAVECL